MKDCSSANKLFNTYIENKNEVGFITKDMYLYKLFDIFYKCKVKNVKNKNTISAISSNMRAFSTAIESNTKVADVDIGVIYNIITNTIVMRTNDYITSATIKNRYAMLKSIFKFYERVTGVRIVDSSITYPVFIEMFKKRNPNITVIDNIQRKQKSNNKNNETREMEKKTNNKIKIIGYEKEHLFSSLKKGDCFILKQDSELYMKTKAIYANRVLVGNACKLSNGDIVLLSDIDEFTKVVVDITATVC